MNKKPQQKKYNIKLIYICESCGDKIEAEPSTSKKKRDCPSCGGHMKQA